MLAADLAFVDVRLRRVDGDERDVEAVELEPEPMVARPEGLLVEHVADVPGVVVSGDEDDVLAVDRAELVLRLLVLLREPVVRQVAGDDDEIGSRSVHLVDRGVQELAAVAVGTHVDVGELCDQHDL